MVSLGSGGAGEMPAGYHPLQILIQDTEAELVTQRAGSFSRLLSRLNHLVDSLLNLLVDMGSGMY